MLAGALFGGEFILIFYGLDYTSAARSTLLVNTMPFWVLIGAHYLLGERVTPVKIAGLALAFCGVAVVLFDRLSMPGPSALMGDLMSIGGGVLWGATTLVIKATRLKDPGPEKLLLYQLAVAGVMTLPMILGNLFGSVFSGQMISRHGRWKIFLVMGATVNIGALALLGTMSHDTNYWILATGMFFNGVGMGFMVQNLVLAVQNTVKVTDIGTASSTVAFFRSVGGAAGVAVLGAMLSDKVSALVIDALTAAHLISPDGSGGVAAGSTSLDLSTMPPAVRSLYEAAFGDATGVIFMASAIVALVSLVCILFIKEVPLRKTI
jgi:hypothetical protein